MYETKKRIYPDFDKTQKSAICNYLRAFVKQNVNLSTEDILDKFTEDQKYYLELNASRFPFLADIIDSTGFLADTSDYIRACKKYYIYKEQQKPLIESQKEFEKKKRKFLQDVKMSKQEPTKKQLYYYDKLCKRYSIEKADTKELSKLDLRNEIDRILNEYSANSEDTD